jgi:hypothetical protein
VAFVRRFVFWSIYSRLFGAVINRIFLRDIKAGILNMEIMKLPNGKYNIEVSESELKALDIVLEQYSCKQPLPAELHEFPVISYEAKEGCIFKGY